jgi:RHS repeat-associated protein
METASSAGITTRYRYNGRGERVVKTSSAGSTYYVYDEQGHLLGEYDATGTPRQETIYLGDLPVAVIKPGVPGPAVYYVYADHLHAPRVLTRASDQQMVWRWDHADPFGLTPPDENPNSLGTFTYNLRFPGQVFDRETNDHYNYFRDYDPQLGRYIQSDPIGLVAGVNTFAYVGGNPLSFVDPRGLAIGDYPPAPPGYNPRTWGMGQWDNGRWVLTDPERNSWTIHPEDSQHWRHWDKQDGDGNDKGPWPPNSGKPWPGQKRLKKNQCEADPNGNAPPWDPNNPMPKWGMPFIPLPGGPLVPVPAPSPMPVPGHIFP